MTEIIVPASFGKFAGQFHQDADVVFNDLAYLVEFTRHNLSRKELLELAVFARHIQPKDDRTLERAWKMSAAEVVLAGPMVRKLLMAVSNGVA